MTPRPLERMSFTLTLTFLENTVISTLGKRLSSCHRSRKQKERKAATMYRTAVTIGKTSPFRVVIVTTVLYIIPYIDLILLRNTKTHPSIALAQTIPPLKAAALR